MKKTVGNVIVAKRLAVAIATVFATLSAPSFAADDSKAVMDFMLKKGLISPQEYDQYMKSAEDAAENKAFKEKRLADDVSKLNKAAEKSSKSGFVRANGFGLESNDGQNTLNVTGRVHFDARSNQNGFGQSSDVNTASLADQFEVRRARIGFNGVLFKDIGYEVVTNLVGSNANLVDTAFINYAFNKEAQIRVGRFKQGFSLEELTSSNNIDFMERSYVNQLVPGKKLGIQLHGEPIPNMTYAVSLSQNGFNELTNQLSLGRSATGRATFNFAQSAGLKDSVLHLGVAANAGKQEANATATSNTSGSASTTTRATFLSFNSEARGLSNIYRAQIGSLALGQAGYGGTSDEAVSVNRRMTGLEAVYATGPLKFQGELVKASIDASSSVSSAAADVAASYLEVMYNITGEKWSDAYRAGAFSGIKPNSNFNPGSGLGAWQLGLRFSQFDVTGMSSPDISENDKKFREQNSRTANTVTVGLNWVLNTNARVMLNYSHTKFGANYSKGALVDGVAPLDVTGVNVVTGDKVATHESMISLRTQINF